MKRFTAILGGVLCLWALFPLGALAAPAQPVRPATHSASHVSTAVQPGSQAAPAKKKPQAVKPKPIYYPTRPLWQKEHPAADPGQGQGDLNYYGGATLKAPVTYLIFWGASWNSSDAGTRGIIASYFNNLPGTSFDKILTQYFDTGGNIASTETLGGAWVDTTAPPTDTSCGLHPTVEDSSIQSEVAHAISANGWPSDALNATYFVYTPAGDYVNSFGECSAFVFCAYHGYTGNAPGTGVAYAAMPYPVPASCPALQSPNGNAAADSLVSVSSHEEFESITDQFPCGSGCPNSAWVDSFGFEIGDKCAWDFSSGYTYLGTGVYFIQEEYSNAVHGCTNTYTLPGTPHMLLGSSAGIDQLTQTSVSPPSQTLTLDNNGSSSLSWSSNTLPSWVSVSPPSGSLAAGSTVPLSVSFNITSPTPQTYSTTLVLSGNADNSPLTIPITLTAIAPPGNDNIASTTTLATLPAYTSVDTTFATTEAGDPNITNCGPFFESPGQFGQSVWYRYTTSGATGLRIDTIGSSYETIAAVFTGSPGSLTQVACSFAYRGTRWSLVNFNASASTTYYIEVVSPFTPFPGSLFNDELNLSVTAGPIVTSTIGVYRPSTSTFLLRNSNSTGGADINVTYGASGDQPVVGDWNFQGYDTIGIWRPSTHTFYLRNTDTAGPADFTVNEGSLSGTPLVGDWFGFGQSMLGLYNPTTSTFTEFFLTTNEIVAQFQFGAPGDIPVVGDWNGEGYDSVGVYRPSNETFYLDTCNCTAGSVITATFGPAGSKPIVGDWTNKGYDSIGVAAGGTFYLRNSNTTGIANTVFAFGAGTDVPLAGRWTPQPGAPFKPPHHDFSPFGPIAVVTEHE